MHTAARAHASQHASAIQKMLLVFVVNGNPSDQSMNMLLREFRRRYQEVKEVVLVPAPGQGRKLPGLLQDLKLKCQREAELADFSLTVRPESSSHRHAKDKLLEATPRLGAKDVYVTFLN